MAITNMQVVKGYYDGLGSPSIETAVTSQLAAGWIPNGAPVLTDVYGQVVQPMVKSENLTATAYTVVTSATPMAPDDTWNTLGDASWIDSNRYIQAYTKGDQFVPKIDLNSQVRGVLPVANGGTGETDTRWLDVDMASRVTGVKESEVVLSNDTGMSLDGKTVVYSVDEQKYYGLPALPSGATMVGVTNGVLTYAPGNVQIALLLAPSPVLTALIEGTGSSLVGYTSGLSGSVYRKLSDRLSDEVNVKDFGATGKGQVDESDAIDAACAAIQAAFAVDGVRRTLFFPDGTYRTSRTIVMHTNMTIRCDLRVVFQNLGTNKDFPAVEIQGGGRPSRFATIDGYGQGILIRANTNEVMFHTISNCVDGVVLRGDTNSSTVNNLDNKVTGVQIGKCTNGIVFEQNANGIIQQGNEFRVNFVSETPNTVLFRNYGGFTHTTSSNWDSNFIELIASDPTKIADSSMIRNSTPYGVPNVTLLVQSWCGGWTPDAGTICLIRGAFTVSTFKFNLAQRVGLDELVDAAGRTSLGSCSVDLCRFTNLGNASAFYQAVTPGSVFNGGIPLHQKKFRIRVAIPDINSGSVHGMAFSHVLAQVSGTARFTIVNVGGAQTARTGLLFEVADAGAEVRGMVRIWCRNISGATLAAREVDLVIESQ